MKLQITAVLILLAATLPAFAENPRVAPPPQEDRDENIYFQEEHKATQESPVTPEKNAAKPEEKSEPQPVTEAPSAAPGFHTGAMIFTFMGGPTIQAMGSFMDHEMAYDSALRTQVQSGVIPEKLGDNTFPGPTFTLKYRSSPILQFDYEHGLFSHLGVGFTLYHFSIQAQRQDVRPGFRQTGPNTTARQDYVDPFPHESLLFMGTGGMLQAVFHPLSENSIDPYVAVRGGIQGHTGSAHEGLYYDPLRFDNKIHNGVGFAMQAALGVNVYMNSHLGFKVEGTYLRQFLKSDVYSARTLDTYHFQAGIFLSIF